MYRGLDIIPCHRSFDRKQREDSAPPCAQQSALGSFLFKVDKVYCGKGKYAIERGAFTGFETLSPRA